jgi:hypothetical protein
MKSAKKLKLPVTAGRKINRIGLAIVVPLKGDLTENSVNRRYLHLSYETGNYKTARGMSNLEKRAF